VSLAVAVIVAAGIALIGFPFSKLQTWTSWGTWRAWILLLAYLSVAATLGGVGGWAVGTAADTRITDFDAVQGLFYGIAGSLVLRADFGTEPNGPEETRNAASVLASLLVWTRGGLESVTLRALREWLADQSDEQVEALAWQAVHELMPTLDDANQFHCQLTPVKDAIKDMHSNNAATRMQGRSRLNAYLRTRYVDADFPRPHARS
jgi:hypothetical protein